MIKVFASLAAFIFLNSVAVCSQTLKTNLPINTGESKFYGIWLSAEHYYSVKKTAALFSNKVNVDLNISPKSSSITWNYHEGTKLILGTTQNDTLTAKWKDNTANRIILKLVNDSTVTCKNCVRNGSFDTLIRYAITTSGMHYPDSFENKYFNGKYYLSSVKNSNDKKGILFDKGQVSGFSNFVKYEVQVDFNDDIPQMDYITFTRSKPDSSGIILDFFHYTIKPDTIMLHTMVPEKRMTEDGPSNVYGASTKIGEPKYMLIKK